MTTYISPYSTNSRRSYKSVVKNADARLDGMTINGFKVEDLLIAYQERNGDDTNVWP